MTCISDQRSEDRSELDFLDHEKINGILNFDLALILAAIIVDQNMIGFLVDGGSSCNILYVETLKLLGI